MREFEARPADELLGKIKDLLGFLPTS